VEFLKYRDKLTKQIVKVMKYTDIHDFPQLFVLIGDVFPLITTAHTRVYEGNWVVRYDTNRVEFFNCKNGERCFEKQYEVYK